MSDQLQDLLKRVYEEGVEKARGEAEQILAKANAEAAALLEKAQTEAAGIVQAAEKKSRDLTQNTDSDLKLAAQHTLSAVKQKLTDVFLDKVFDSSLQSATADPEFMKKIILEIVATWKESGGKITIAGSLQGKLDEFFLKSLAEQAGKGLQVEFSPQMKNGFAIAPADGSYKLSFTDEDFANLFKSHLRPRSNQILFKQ